MKCKRKSILGCFNTTDRILLKRTGVLSYNEDCGYYGLCDLLYDALQVPHKDNNINPDCKD